jgi:hypothetical protein
MAIGLSRKQQVFAVVESTKGTIVFPAATDFIVCTEEVVLEQGHAWSDVQEIQTTRDILEQVQGQIPSGTWSLTCNFRAQAAGSVPQADILFQCLMGTKTVNPGTSIVYSQGEKESFSLWVMKDHFLEAAAGCSVDSLEVVPQQDKTVQLKFSGKFMKYYWCGTGALSGDEAAGQTVLSVADYKQFGGGIGCRVWNVTKGDNNSNAGYAITAVTSGDGTITVGTALPVGGWSSGDVIAPYLPTGTKIGTIVEGRKTVLTFASATTVVKAASVKINDPAYFLDDEITASGYCEDFIDGDTREITADLELLFRSEKAAYFYEAFNNTTKIFQLVMGTAAGYRMKLLASYGKMSMPKPEYEGPAVKVPINVKALGSTGEDSLTITIY